MKPERINESLVDEAFNEIQQLRHKAWILTVPNVMALAERVRVEIMLNKTMSRSRRRWYRAYSVYLDDVAAQRTAKEGREGQHQDSRVSRYMRWFTDNE